MVRFYASVTDINAWVDFWYDQIGVNTIPQDSKNKKPIVKWKPFQKDPVSFEQKEQWKQDGAYNNGIMTNGAVVADALRYVEQKQRELDKIDIQRPSESA